MKKLVAQLRGEEIPPAWERKRFFALSQDAFEALVELIDRSRAPGTSAVFDGFQRPTLALGPPPAIRIALSHQSLPNRSFVPVMEGWAKEPSWTPNITPQVEPLVMSSGKGEILEVSAREQVQMTQYAETLAEQKEREKEGERGPCPRELILREKPPKETDGTGDRAGDGNGTAGLQGEYTEVECHCGVMERKAKRHRMRCKTNPVH